MLTGARGADACCTFRSKLGLVQVPKTSGKYWIWPAEAPRLELALVRAGQLERESEGNGSAQIVEIGAGGGAWIRGRFHCMVPGQHHSSMEAFQPKAMCRGLFHLSGNPGHGSRGRSFTMCHPHLSYHFESFHAKTRILLTGRTPVLWVKHHHLY